MVIDAATCVNSGKCMVITNGSAYISVGVFAIMLLGIILLVLVLYWTPAMTFLKAKLRRASVMLVFNKSQRARFFVGKSQHEGVVHVNGVGPFNLTGRSHLLEHKSSVPMYAAFAEFFYTVPLWYPHVIQELKNKGMDIRTIGDLATVVAAAKKDDRLPEHLRKAAEEFENINLRPYETIKLHELTSMFPFDVTPANVESLITAEKAKQLRFWQKFNMQTVIMVGILVFILALSAGMAWKFFSKGETQNIHLVIDQAGMVKDAGGALLANLTG